MQQPGPMFPIMPSFPPTNITTEQIQKFLDENKKLILAILDNQNLGKLDECAQYQAHLQKNLMYLAAIADAQPQTPTMSPQQHMQTSPHPALAMQQGGFLMQHPQAVSPMTQQPGMFPQKMPLQFGSPLQMPAPQQLHQGLMGMRSAGPTNKQDVPATGASGGGDSSASGHGGVGGDLSSQMKATEESK